MRSDADSEVSIHAESSPASSERGRQVSAGEEQKRALLSVSSRRQPSSSLGSPRRPHLNLGYLDRQQFTPFLGFSVFAAILGAFLFGWNIGVINTPRTVMTTCKEGQEIAFLSLPACIPMPDELWGFVVSVFPLGGLVGGTSGGNFCKWFGRRSTMIYNNILFVLSALLMGLATDFYVLALGRFVAGIACGIATCAAPMYLAEVPPTRFRGTVGAIHQLAVVFGILLSQVFSIFVDADRDEPIDPQKYVGWRILIAIPVIPAILQVMLLGLFGVESPRYLITLNENEEARRGLRKLRGTTDVEDELDYMISITEQERAQQAHAMTIMQLFTRRNFRKPLLIAVLAHLSQQLSGINGVMQFSTDIFGTIMSGKASAHMTIVVGVINLFMTLLAVYLMDRAGRRVLFLTSQFGMAVACTLIVLGYLFHIGLLTSINVITFVALFAIGLGPIPWMIIPEIFPTSAVGAACSVGMSVNWISNVAVSYLFTIMVKALGDWVFAPFAACNLFLGLLMFCLLPETKGRSVEEVAAMLE